MIKHALKDNLLSISIAKKDFSYRIPIGKLDNTIDWKIGESGTEVIVMKNVSTWTLQLFTKNITEDKYVKQFKDIVEEHSPKSKINWDDTLLAVTIQNKYNWLISTNEKAEKKISENEIILNLKKKYNLD